MSQPTPFEMSKDGFLVDACGRAVVLPCEWPTDARSRKIAAANARELVGVFARLADLEALKEEVDAAVADHECDDFAGLMSEFDDQAAESQKQADKLAAEVSRLEEYIKDLEGTAP